jgi:hypothetical protein
MKILDEGYDEECKEGEAEAESILDTRRTDESRLIHLFFPASESTEVSDAVDTYYRIENTAVET